MSNDKGSQPFPHCLFTQKLEKNIEYEVQSVPIVRLPYPCTMMVVHLIPAKPRYGWQGARAYSLRKDRIHGVGSGGDTPLLIAMVTAFREMVTGLQFHVFFLLSHRGRVKQGLTP